MSTLKENILPASYFIGEEIDWSASWIDVSLWVELPFWLMIEDTTVDVEVGGHNFETAIHEHYFELHGGLISDSKQNVIYQGPPKNIADLSVQIKETLKSRPEIAVLWRKSKTVLKVKSRCNEFVWNTRIQNNDVIKNAKFPMATKRAIDFYLIELCRAHIPVINKLIQQYRLATYDYFPYEVSPWDVSHWFIERNANGVHVNLVPYREWDIRPRKFAQPFNEVVQAIREGKNPDPPSIPYIFIEPNELRNKMSFVAGPGEFELMDALNLMERGDYSSAVRRVTTAIEVVVEAKVRKCIDAKDGEKAAVRFLRETETNFPRRISRYEELSGRSLPDVLRTELQGTRKLRHKIVHRGYRIAPNERGRAQKAVDTGRWIFNWFENDKVRFDIREKKIALRSLGRDIAAGVFPTKITPDGVVVSPFHRVQTDLDS